MRTYTFRVFSIEIFSLEVADWAEDVDEAEVPEYEPEYFSRPVAEPHVVFTPAFDDPE